MKTKNKHKNLSRKIHLKKNWKSFKNQTYFFIHTFNSSSGKYQNNNNFQWNKQKKYKNKIMKKDKFDKEEIRKSFLFSLSWQQFLIYFQFKFSYLQEKKRKLNGFLLDFLMIYSHNIIF